MARNTAVKARFFKGLGLSQLEFGLSGSSQNLVPYTEDFPTCYIAYTCGLLSAFDYGGDVVKLDINDGKLVVMDGVFDKVREAFKGILPSGANPIAQLDLIASEVGEGKVTAGVWKNGPLVSFYISIDTTIKVSDTYSTSVTVTMSISPKPGDPMDPTQIEIPWMDVALVYWQTAMVIEQVATTLLSIAAFAGLLVLSYGKIAKYAAALLPWLIEHAAGN